MWATEEGFELLSKRPLGFEGELEDDSIVLVPVRQIDQLAECNIVAFEGFGHICELAIDRRLAWRDGSFERENGERMLAFLTELFDLDEIVARCAEERSRQVHRQIVGESLESKLVAPLDSEPISGR